MVKSNNKFNFVNNNSLNDAKIYMPTYSYWKSFFSTIIKRKIFIVSLIIFLIIILLAIFANIGKTSYEILHIDGDIRTVTPPSAEHIFGTYKDGLDYWSVLWLGTNKTLFFILILGLFEIFVGILIGSIWGYFNKLDIFFIQLISLISLIPSLMFFIIVQIFLGMGFWQVVLSVIITAWIGFATTTRNNINYVKHTEYNCASIILGTPWYKILVNNILPHIFPILIHSMSFIIPSVIGTDMVVAFLGFKYVDPSATLNLNPTISLGYILEEVLSDTYIESYSFQYVVWIPLGLAIVMSVSGFFVMKEIADAANPKLHK